MSNPKVHASTSCPSYSSTCVFHKATMLPTCAFHCSTSPYVISYVIHLHLRRTCVHHMCTMRNPCPLMSSPNPNSNSRLFPILLDPKFFQTALDYSSLSHDFQVTCLSPNPMSICRLIITKVLTLTLVQSLSILLYHNIVHRLSFFCIYISVSKD